MLKKEIIEFIKSPIGKFAVGMLVFIVVASGIAAEKYFNRDKAENEAANTPPQQEQQVVTSTISETAVETSNNSTSTEQVGAPESNEVLPSVESLEIDASLFSDPEKLVKTFENDRMTAWFNAGATPENARAAIDSYDPLSYAQKIADQYDPIFIDSLLTGNRESNPSIDKKIKRAKEIHLSTLYGYFLTSRPNIHPEDKEPYRRDVEVTEVVSTKKYEYNKDKITVNIIKRDRSNGTKNRMSTEQFGNAAVSEDNYNAELTFCLEKDNVKLCAEEAK